MSQYPTPGGGGDSSTWSQYPATQDVDFDSNNLNDVGNISSANLLLEATAPGGGVSILAKTITQTYTASGQSVGMGAFNSSNTAGSDAVVLIGTGGSSAGDPTTLYTAGLVNFASGLDNSTGQYKIASGSDLGTSADIIAIDDTGLSVYGSGIGINGQYTQAQGNVSISILNGDQTDGDATFTAVTNSTSGDAFTHYFLSDSSTPCSTGLDNSDGQSYKVSFGIRPGTNDVYTVAPDGTTLITSLPQTGATDSGDVTIRTGDTASGTTGDIILDTGLSSGGSVGVVIIQNGELKASPGIGLSVGTQDSATAPAGMFFLAGSGTGAATPGADIEFDAGSATGSATPGNINLYPGTNGVGIKGAVNIGGGLISEYIVNASMLTPKVSVNMNTSATTPLFTVPTGYSARILAVLSTVTTVIAGAPTNSVGTTPTFANIVASAPVPASGPNVVSVSQPMVTASPQLLVVSAGTVISVVIANTAGVTGVVSYQLRIELF